MTTVDTPDHSSQTPSTKSNVSTIGRGEVKVHGCKALGCRSSRDQAVPQFTDDRELGFNLEMDAWYDLPGKSIGHQDRDHEYMLSQSETGAMLDAVCASIIATANAPTWLTAILTVDAARRGLSDQDEVSVCCDEATLERRTLRLIRPIFSHFLTRVKSHCRRSGVTYRVEMNVRRPDAAGPAPRQVVSKARGFLRQLFRMHRIPIAKNAPEWLK